MKRRVVTCAGPHSERGPFLRREAYQLAVRATASKIAAEGAGRHLNGRAEVLYLVLAGGHVRGFWRELARRLSAARAIYEGIFLAPYRAEIHREYLRRRDLFLLLGFSDLLGVPNPVAFYTLELYPELIEQFHEWHLRMGMPDAPDGGFRCC